MASRRLVSELLERRHLLTAVADLDRDGDLDVIAASSWHENVDGFGATFLQRRIAPDFVTASAIGDLDGDGDFDFITNEPKWYANSGSGDFTMTHDLPVITHPINRWKVIDFRRDGDLDLIALAADRATLIENMDGRGTMQIHSSIEITCTQPGEESCRLVDVDDVDSDGDLDGLYNFRGVNPDPIFPEGVNGAKIHLNQGQGSFSQVTLGSCVQCGFDGHALIDVDNDTRVDAVTSIGVVGFFEFFWQKNNGDGSFTAHHIVSFDGIFGSSSKLSDIDADGDVDFAWSVSSPESDLSGVHWSRNDGELGFRPAWSVAGEFIRFVDIGDINRDGVQDFVTNVESPAWTDGVDVLFASEQSILSAPYEAIDALQRHLRTPNLPLNRNLDLNRDSRVDAQDLNQLTESILNIPCGDVNFDRQFNSADLIAVFQAGEYEDLIVGNSTWADGDWDGDGEFTTSDLVKAFQAGRYVAA